MFSGNNYNISTKKNDIFPYFTARFARIKPKSCVGRCALRLEFYGQYESKSNYFVTFIFINTMTETHLTLLHYLTIGGRRRGDYNLIFKSSRKKTLTGTSLLYGEVITSSHQVNIR